MCGISGIVSADGGLRDRDLDRSLDAQRHRGPDGSGTWADGYCALGHRRLAIIDLTDSGRQPMCNEDATVWITFNGEIYNFQSLRTELEGLGHQFHSRTDTEVILHAYEQWGSACVRRLRGMCAFAIWDQKARRLFAARDRVGKKPFFYTTQGDRLYFASELQALLTHPDVPRDADPHAIDAYLSLGYIPPPRTGFKGIQKLPAGHWLKVDLSAQQPRVRVERYWSLDYQTKVRISEDEACEALREKITDAVRLRLISDVPVGAFLSGGIDSSIVVGLMAKLSPGAVKTFSIGFEEASFNELGHARRVAERWGTQHQELVVRPDALAILPTLVRHYGEPFADSSAIPTFYVSQMTRAGVTVALNGDGGDESFAGYERYLGNQLAERIRRVPGCGAMTHALMRLLPDSANSKSPLRRARRFLSVAAQPMARRYQRWLGYFDQDDKNRLYSGDLRNELEGSKDPVWPDALFMQTVGMDPAEAAMAVDVQSYLPYDLLVKVDIASMANSLEARSPLLDQEVMEFAAQLPIDMKLRGGRLKHLLKQAFADLLPPENVNRSKMGFGVPVGEWFRGPLRELLQDTLLSNATLSREWFEPNEVRRLVGEHVDGKADHRLMLWNLLMLELWSQELVQAPAAGVLSR
ncbi:MAG: asparagine synthase (glutamine-hydrolyzing) [Actinomycetota bacterium]